MKIVIAPDSFKESLSAEKCCQAIKAGFSTLFPDANYICLPIADGGEGTGDAMVAATGGNIVTLEVCGPMGEKVNAFYGLTGDGKTAVIEMAAASGLMLVAPEKRNPLLASSFGTGELIRHALDNGIRHIILGIGGSATVDGGMGMAQALGVRFLDADGQVLVANGGNLARVASIEMDECDPRLANCHIEVACDVDNPLVGARGAAAVFGPQKGATPEMVEELEQGGRNCIDGILDTAGNHRDVIAVSHRCLHAGTSHIHIHRAGFGCRPGHRQRNRCRRACGFRNGNHIQFTQRVGLAISLDHTRQLTSRTTNLACIVCRRHQYQTVGNNLCTVIGMTNQQRCSAVLCSIRRLVIHFRIKQRNQRIRRNGVKAYRHRYSPFYSRAGYHPLLHGAASSCSRQHFALRRAKGRRGQGQALTAL